MASATSATATIAPHPKPLPVLGDGFDQVLHPHAAASGTAQQQQQQQQQQEDLIAHSRQQERDMAGSPSSIVNVAFLRSGAEFSNTSNLSNPAQLSRSWDDLHERPVPNRQRKLDQFYDKTLGAVSQAVKEGLKPSPPVTRRTRCVSEGANDERQGGQSPASLVNLEFLRSGKEFSDPTKQSKAMNAEPIISPRQRLNQFHDQMLNAYATSKRTEAV